MGYIRFTKMGASNVLFQSHVSDDSRFVLLPVLEQNTTITGWLVYDSTTGDLLERPEGGPWTALQPARQWVIDHYYREKAG